MTEYIVLIPGNEAEWDQADEAERTRVYGLHQKFWAALAERGHKVTNAAELAPSREAKTVTRSGDSLQVTDGPYAEAVEQLTGYYIVDTENLDDLLQCVGILAEGESKVEVRACLKGSDEG